MQFITFTRIVSDYRNPISGAWSKNDKRPLKVLLSAITAYSDHVIFAGGLAFDVMENGATIASMLDSIE